MPLPSSYKAKNFYKTALPLGGWGEKLEDLSDEMVTYLVSVVRAGANQPLGRQTQSIVTAATRVLAWTENEKDRRAALDKDQAFFGLFPTKEDAVRWLIAETPRLLALAGVVVEGEKKNGEVSQARLGQGGDPMP